VQAGQSVLVTLNVSDLNGDTPLVSSVVGALPAGATATPGNGVLTVNATSATPGTYTISFRVTDPSGAQSAPANLVLVVTPIPCSASITNVNQSPVANNNDLTLKKTVVVTITSTGSCNALRLRYNRGDGNGIQLAVVGSGLVAFPANTATERWSKATHALELVIPGSPDQIFDVDQLKVT